MTTATFKAQRYEGKGQTVDLNVAGAADTATIKAGNDVTYTWTVTNNGSGSALAINLDDVLPAGLAYSSFNDGAGDGWACSDSGGTVTCTLPRLVSGGSSSVELVLDTSALSGTTVDNSVTVSTPMSDTDDTNDSATVNVAINIAPVFDATPTLSGSAAVGNPLTAVAAVTDANGDSVTLSYQWQADGVAIDGATAASYTLTSAEAHQTITVTVTADDGALTTAATSAGVAVANTAPVFDAAPTVSGSATVGATLSVNDAAASDIDGDAVSFTYLWLADGLYAGSGSSYTVQAADADKTLTCIVIATDEYGSAVYEIANAFSYAAVSVADKNGAALGDTTLKRGATLTLTPGGGSGGYTVAAGSNAAGVSGTVIDNGDGTWSFKPASNGAFAGEYVITVTDTLTGSEQSLTVTVPLVVSASANSLLGEVGSADIAIKGAAAGTVFSVDVVDSGGSSVNGMSASIATSAVASDDEAGGNPASLTLSGGAVTADTRVRVTAAAAGYPDGTRTLKVIAAETFSGTVVDSGSTAVEAATVSAQGLTDASYQPYQATTDVNGQFTLVAPKSADVLMAAKEAVGSQEASAASCLGSGFACTLTLFSATGSDTLAGESGSASVTPTAQTVALSRAVTPVVIAGVPSTHGSGDGVVRVSNVSTIGFDLRFQEWGYLDGSHSAETVAWLALEPGRYSLPDGSVWEVGSFSLGNTGVDKAVSFSEAFAAAPRLFLTVQTENDADAVVARAKAVSSSGFTVALYEEEAKMDGHVSETVGYLAIYSPAQGGSLDLDGASVTYALEGARVNHGASDVLAGSYRIRLREEESLDTERKHPGENVDLLQLDTGLFGQDVTVRSADTVSLRFR